MSALRAMAVTDGPAGVRMTDITITIPGRPPNPNDYRGRNGGGHWTKRGQERREWRKRAWVEASLQKPHGWQPLESCVMAVEFVVPDRRRRDLDNLVASTKALTDGIVEAGVIADDSTDVIRQVSYTVRYAKGESATVYRIVAA